ncbi:MAG TPA: TIGR00366 family protein, partial [Vicinamibacteria bacterium]|nr:TIGR00366 family protein [Vicinamibacteria bacterium]
MIGRLGLLISRVFRRTAPDPFVLAILLTLLTALLALGWGDVPRAGGQSALSALFDAWRSNAGLWKLLDFGMQMCLILVSGHALAASRPAARAIARLAGWPRSTRQAAVLVSFVACLTSVLNWGLCLIAGALLARETGRSLSRRGIRAHYPLICAAGYMGLLVWHGGFSGSATLTMTSPTEAAKVLPPAYVERLGERGVPLTETTFSALNVFVTLGLLAGIPTLMGLLAPGREADLLPIESFRPRVGEPPAADGPAETIPDRLDRSPVLAALLGIPLLLVLARHVALQGAAALDLKVIIAAMVGLGLVLHGSPRSYLAAVEEGAGACGGIILQFPLYAGIMGMMEGSGLVRQLALGFTSLGPPGTVPITSFLAACVINMFIPSGGGHWAVQGPVALAAGMEAGIAPGKMILSVAYGGEVTDMLQP